MILRAFFRPAFTSLLVVLLAACSSLNTPPAPPAALPQAQQKLSPTASPPALAATPVATSTGNGAGLAAPQTEASPPVAEADPFAMLAASRMEPRDMIAVAEGFQGLPDIDPTIANIPRTEQVGDTVPFWLIDRSTESHYSSTFKLRYSGPLVQIFVEQGVEVDQQTIERNAITFEQQIYPRNHQLFGIEWTPGVDGDPRLTVLLANLPGVGGYFSSRDSLPAIVNRYSNQREMFYINVGSNPGPTLDLGAVLAHEFQHMIHWQRNRTSPTWFNEGLSTLAEDLNGHVSQSLPQAYLRDTDLQLTGWTYQPPRSLAHYGAAQLFWRYIHAQYSGDQGIDTLITEDAGHNTEAFVRLARQKRPEIESFAQIVGDWAVANLINDPTVDNGRFAYDLLSDTVTPTSVDVGPGEGSAYQFGADYLRLPAGPITLRFDGGDQTRLLAAQPDGGHAWWSNRGDDSMATLTRPLDLRNVQAASLTFDTWFEIETGYDYVFVAVSNDNGTTWQTLPGKYTTDEDPQGANLGHGFTGVSGSPGIKTTDGTRGQWLSEQMNLTPFAGKEILLRFWYITDDAESAPGMLLDNIAVPEIGWRDDAELANSDWQATGFVRTGVELPQQWVLQLVRQTNETTHVERLVTDAQGRSEARIEAGEQATLVVVPTTPFSSETAAYSYDIITK